MSPIAKLLAVGAAVLCGSVLTGCSYEYTRDVQYHDIVAFEAAAKALDRPLQRPAEVPMKLTAPKRWNVYWLKSFPRDPSGCFMAPEGTVFDDVGIEESHSFMAVEALVYEWSSCQIQGDGVSLSGSFECPTDAQRQFDGTIATRNGDVRGDIPTSGTYGISADMVPARVMCNSLFTLCLDQAGEAAFDRFGESWPENMSAEVLYETWIELCSGGERNTAYKEWRAHLFGVGGAAYGTASATEGVLVDVLVRNGHDWSEAIDAVVGQYKAHNVRCDGSIR